MGDCVLGMGWGNTKPLIYVPQVLGCSRHQESGKREWLPHFQGNSRGRGHGSKARPLPVRTCIRLDQMGKAILARQRAQVNPSYYGVSAIHGLVFLRMTMYCVHFELAGE